MDADRNGNNRDTEKADGLQDSSPLGFGPDPIQRHGFIKPPTAWKSVSEESDIRHQKDVNENSSVPMLVE